jgi:hypothetical protein
VLTLNNATDSPRRVVLSMRLASKENAPLVLAGDALAAEVRGGPNPIAFERPVTLAPGANPVEIRLGKVETKSAASNAAPREFLVLDVGIKDRVVR